MDPAIDPFDLSAAYLRKARGDHRALMAGLAARLEGALPDAVTVSRKRDGLFSSTSHVAAITVATGTSLLTLTAAHGQLKATRAKVIRGVAIGSVEIAVPAWLDEVTRAGDASGADAEAARATLHDFLMS